MASSQWLTFPLPDEMNKVEPWMPPTSQSNKTFPVSRSPKTKTGLAYVDNLYIVGARVFPDFMEKIKQMFDRHNIPTSSIQWRLDNRDEQKCNDKTYNETYHEILNLSPELIGNAVCLKNILINDFFI